MASLTVCTAAYYRNIVKIKPMLVSARKFNITPQTYGLGKTFPGHIGAKVVGLIEFLKTVKTDYTLYLDGNDTLFRDGVTRIMEAYRLATTGQNIVLLGNEKACWPFSHMKDDYQSSSPWKYPCPGVMMGKTKKLLTALRALKRNMEEYLDFLGDRPLLRNDDQGLWLWALRNKKVKAVVDDKCLLSVTLKQAQPKDWKFDKRGFWFKPTKTRPCIIHCNGHRYRDRQKLRWMRGAIL